MAWLIFFALITIGSVITAMRKRKPIIFVVPFAAVFTFMVIKVALVPLPFWETVQFIFNLRG
ncbi:hypothetical protein ACFFGV_18695 [Pontibacillus salicampi]|uniref:Uncharacterized protein n=1 Tax=Pontibacillus salicampi TaxID=1449801 RepID=A0ABV6LT73_9BACI